MYQKKKFSSKVQFKTTPKTIKFCQCHWSPTSRCVLKGQIAEDSNPDAHGGGGGRGTTVEHNSSHFSRLLTQWYCSQLKGIQETREENFRNDFFPPLVCCMSKQHHGWLLQKSHLLILNNWCKKNFYLLSLTQQNNHQL